MSMSTKLGVVSTKADSGTAGFGGDAFCGVGELAADPAGCASCAAVSLSGTASCDGDADADAAGVAALADAAWAALKASTTAAGGGCTSEKAPVAEPGLTKKRPSCSKASKTMSTSSWRAATFMLNAKRLARLAQKMDYEGWSRQQLAAAPTAAPAAAPVDAGRKDKAGKHDKRKRLDEQRPFDFSKHRARHIALKVAYIGDAYHGFSSASSLASTTGTAEGAAATANVDDAIPTVEAALFRALLTAKLVPSIADIGWSRCGRTDRGVSAFGQVVSLWIRTSRPSDASTLSWPEVAALSSSDRSRTHSSSDRPVSATTTATAAAVIASTTTAAGDGSSPELQYLTTLNRLLPSDIRVLAWSPVDAAFDARFTCTSRRYNYFFDGEGLDIAAMQEAAQLFVGTHDCRHVCKIDASKVDRDRFFERTVSECRIVPSAEIRGDVVGKAGGGTDALSRMNVLVVEGRAFLWHQVRNMMALLTMVGRRQEQPSIISQMLDMSVHPPNAGRPLYDMAPDGPLVLVDCLFPPSTLHWLVRDDAAPNTTLPGVPNDTRVAAHVLDLWRVSATRTLQLETLLSAFVRLGAHPPPPLPLSADSKKHVPLLTRARADSVETVARKAAATKRGQKRARGSAASPLGDDKKSRMDSDE
ncbi:pseudouridine synthase [Entophlyctis helioformis]|nr:pseudouridine synthase [Entophlyctis helioformis]